MVAAPGRSSSCKFLVCFFVLTPLKSPLPPADPAVVRRLRAALPLHGPLTAEALGAAVAGEGLSAHRGIAVFRHVRARVPGDAPVTTACVLESVLMQ